MNRQQEYWQYFDMKRDPFAKTQDAAVDYLSLQSKQYIEFLADLDNYQKAMVLITGEPGVGKTTLLAQLVDKLPQDVQYQVLKGDECHGAEKLLAFIEANFNAPIDKDINLNLYDKANLQLTHLQQINKRHLLVIDDAEQLPQDVQQILLHWVQQQLSGHVVLQIIMAGKPDMVEAMQDIASQHKPDETAHIVNTLTLDAFDREEMQAYLAYRFSAAGLGSQPSPLRANDLDYLYQESDGVAAKINQLTESLLRGYFMEQEHEQHENKSPLLKRYIWWGCTIVVVAVLLIWVLPMLQSRSTDNIKPISLPVQPQTNDSQYNPNPDYTQPQNDRRNQNNLGNASQNPPQPSNYNNQAQPTQTDQAMQPGDQPNDTTSDQTAAPEQQPTASSEPIVSAPVAATPASPPAPMHRKSVVHHKPVVHKSKRAHSVQAVKPAMTQVEAQLLKINPHYYTIQLVGAYKKSDVIAFMRTHKIENEAVYFHTFFNSKSWYVLITGDYASMDQAKAARAKLPAHLRNLKPWIRSFASVQKSIKMQP